jgi:hypothetical protein
MGDCGMKCVKCDEEARKIDDIECQVLCEKCCENGSHCDMCLKISELLTKIKSLECCGNCANYNGLIGEQTCNKNKDDDGNPLFKESGDKCEEWEARG